MGCPARAARQPPCWSDPWFHERRRDDASSSDEWMAGDRPIGFGRPPHSPANVPGKRRKRSEVPDARLNSNPSQKFGSLLRRVDDFSHGGSRPRRHAPRSSGKFSFSTTASLLPAFCPVRMAHIPGLLESWSLGVLGSWEFVDCVSGAWAIRVRRSPNVSMIFFLSLALSFVTGAPRPEAQGPESSFQSIGT